MNTYKYLWTYTENYTNIYTTTHNKTKQYMFKYPEQCIVVNAPSVTQCKP